MRYTAFNYPLFPLMDCTRRDNAEYETGRRRSAHRASRRRDRARDCAHIHVSDGYGRSRSHRRSKSGAPVCESSHGLKGNSLWKSATECVFTVREVIPGASYRLTLVPQLADASGKPVEAPDWSAEFTTPQFSVTADFEESEHLSSSPADSLSSRTTACVLRSWQSTVISRIETPASVSDRGDSDRRRARTEGHEFRVGPRQPLQVRPHLRFNR